MLFGSIIGFGLKNWKSVVALAVGFGVAWYIQGIRVEYAKSEVSSLKSQIDDCQNASKTNQETIENLKAEIKNTQGLCNARLGVKDRVIRRLQEIDELKGKPNNEVRDEKGIATDDDPILHELNRMFIKADSKD